MSDIRDQLRQIQAHCESLPADERREAIRALEGAIEGLLPKHRWRVTLRRQVTEEVEQEQMKIVRADTRQEAGDLAYRLAEQGYESDWVEVDREEMDFDMEVEQCVRLDEDGDDEDIEAEDEDCLRLVNGEEE